MHMAEDGRTLLVGEISRIARKPRDERYLEMTQVRSRMFSKHKVFAKSTSN